MRLAFKTASYGVTHIIVATGVAYTLTQNLAAAIGIGLIEPIIQTGVYSLHEYLWERSKGMFPKRFSPAGLSTIELAALKGNFA